MQFLRICGFITQVKELDLWTAYTSKYSTQTYIRKMMCLPLLPLGQIRPQFCVLKGEARTDQLKGFCAYMETTWIEDGLWGPEAWCKFDRSIRTHKYIEGMFEMNLFWVLLLKITSCKAKFV